MGRRKTISVICGLGRLVGARFRGFARHQCCVDGIPLAHGVLCVARGIDAPEFRAIGYTGVQEEIMFRDGRGRLVLLEISGWTTWFRLLLNQTVSDPMLTLFSPFHISIFQLCLLQPTFRDTEQTMAGSLVHTILWSVFAIFAGSTGFFYFLAVPKPSSERSFHYITGAITMIAAISCGFRIREGSDWKGELLSREFLWCSL